MALVRSQIEAVLVSRCGNLMRLPFIGMDASTVDGTNASLGDPVATALRALGIYVDDPTDPTSAEMGDVTNADTNQILDRAELRLLETILQNWGQPDAQMDTDRQDWGRLHANLIGRVAQLRDRIDALYPDEDSEPDGGLVSYGFQETDDLAEF